MIKELVERELAAKKLTAKKIRMLPKDQRAAIITKMTSEALPAYNRFRHELEIEEIDDGII